jgi:delta 1-pyrroline-5-carboxylate dehydrogenase
MNPSHEETVGLVMSEMGNWLAGLVKSLSTAPDWSAKPPEQKAAALRSAVVNRLGVMSKEHDALLKTYFHRSGGTWQALLSEVLKVHLGAGGEVHHS